MKCPYCAEEIKEEAIVCRYCGRDLSFFKLTKPILEKISSLESQISEITAFLEDLKTGAPSSVTSSPPSSKNNPSPLHSLLAVAIPALFWTATATPLFPTYTAWPLLLALLISLIFGFWFGIAWPGKHLKAYTLLGITIGVMGVIGVSLVFPLGHTLQPPYATIPFFPGNYPTLFAVTVAPAMLFIAGALFADFWKMRKQPREKIKSGLAQKVANKVTAPGKEPSRTTVLLIQLLAPFVTGLIGLVTVFIGFYRAL